MRTSHKIFTAVAMAALFVGGAVSVASVSTASVSVSRPAADTPWGGNAVVTPNDTPWGGGSAGK